MDEFTLINKYLKSLSLKNTGSLNLSDDIYFDSKKNTAISVDTYVEGVHFISSFDPNKFLKRILRASLSDLYCKGVKPKSYFLSLALNKKFVNHTWLKKFKKILQSEQKKFKISLGGGDTTFSSKLTITVIVLGYPVYEPILRKGCSLNDDIFVTGNIGDSFIGLSILKKKNNFGSLNNYFIKKYYQPNLQTQLSRFLHKIASSSIDISDGLAQDLTHLCTSSKFGALVDLNKLPISPICKKLVNSQKIQLTKIFSKGDDYQILFTSHPKNRHKIKSLSLKLRTKISKIGIINRGKNIVFKFKNKKFKLESKKMGYIHNFWQRFMLPFMVFFGNLRFFNQI